MSRWTLAYEDFEPTEERLRETLTTLGNGYFATRGAAPETGAGKYHYPATYVAGLFNRLGTEMAGRVIENEDMVNVPNWLPLRFRAAGEDWIDLETATLIDYRQTLEMRTGVLVRSFCYEDRSGRQTRVAQRRIVSMQNPHVAALETTLLAENWSGTMEVESALDGGVTNSGVPRYSQLANQHLDVLEAGGDEESAYLLVETNQSRVQVALAMNTSLVSEGEAVPAQREFFHDGARLGHVMSFELEDGAQVTVQKLVTLYTSRDQAISNCLLDAGSHLARLPSFEVLVERHSLAWDRVWRRFRLEVDADEESTMVLNLHIFHLLQTVSPHSIDLDVGVPARGLHGEAYRGHIFWDELFIFPFINLHLPELTRSLLHYRYRRLSAARWAAAAEGLDGALFPWQSGSNGREESQVVHLNPQSNRWIPDHSYLQRHINIAVAFNVWQYYEGTGDVDFMAYYGAEMLVEIARLMASLANYNKALDRWEIRGVMGPDEYHDGYPDTDEPGLNNNAYTNIMAVWILERAAEALELVPEYRRQGLEEKLGLRREEIQLWDEIGSKMMIPFHDDVLSQFEGYGDLEEFDWIDYRERYGDIQRLDRILEAEGDTPNRYKLSKQADVLMLFYLLAEEELEHIFEKLGYEWDPNIVARTIDYYLERTSHGSTLSRIVHSWVLARSDRHRSWDFFREALMSDVTDIQGGTTQEGIHLGAMAGTVDLVQRGYAGLRIHHDTLWLDPALPEEFDALRFEVRYRGQWVKVAIADSKLTVSTSPGEGGPISMRILGEEAELIPGSSYEAELEPAPAEDPEPAEEPVG